MIGTIYMLKKLSKLKKYSIIRMNFTIFLILMFLNLGIREIMHKNKIGYHLLIVVAILLLFYRHNG